MECKGIVANLKPQLNRGLLLRGTLDALGMHDVPVGVGTNGGSSSHTDTFTETANEYIPALHSERAQTLWTGHRLLRTTFEVRVQSSGSCVQARCARKSIDVLHLFVCFSGRCPAPSYFCCYPRSKTPPCSCATTRRCLFPKFALAWSWAASNRSLTIRQECLSRILPKTTSMTSPPPASSTRDAKNLAFHLL